MTVQSPLWEESRDTTRQQVSPDSDRITAGCGDVVELPLGGWADDGTSQAALERLAAITLGDLELRTDIDGRTVYFRILMTRVEGERVIATCRCIESPLKGVSPRAPCEGEDDDE
jgi:hypothetical protein